MSNEIILYSQRNVRFWLGLFGETFARNMLFLMTATMCQQFDFVLGPNDRLPDLSQNLNGLIISPPDFWVQLKDRHCT